MSASADALLIAVLLFGSATPAAPASVEGGPDLLAQANAALDARRFREAVRLFEEAAAAWPERPEVFYGLGRAYWGPDRLYPISAGKAIDAFARALLLVGGKNPALETPILEALVVVFLRSERVSEARSIYVKLLERETRPERLNYMKTQIGEIDLDLGAFEPDEVTITNRSRPQPCCDRRLHRGTLRRRSRHALPRVPPAGACTRGGRRRAGPRHGTRPPRLPRRAGLLPALPGGLRDAARHPRRLDLISARALRARVTPGGSRPDRAARRSGRTRHRPPRRPGRPRCCRPRGAAP